MIIDVEDPFDPRLDRFRWRERQLASRADRLESVGAGLFVAEGDLVVDRALDAGCVPVALLCDDRTGGSYRERVGSADIFVGSEELRKEVTGLGVPLKATGLFRRPALQSVDQVFNRATWVVVVEAIDNPTNLGAIVRSAVALGFEALILDSTSADPLARRALRVSMGTALGLPFARLEPGDSMSELLRRHSAVSYALSPDLTATDISLVSTPHGSRVAVVLGSERNGLTHDTMSAATTSVRIPMHENVDSLNVGAAAAIAFHLLGPNGRGARSVG